MDLLLQVGGPATAVVTAFLSYLGVRRMMRHEHLKEEVRQVEKQRADEVARQRVVAEAAELARVAVLTERDQLLTRWQKTLDQAYDERRRLVEDHRLELTRLAKVRRLAEAEIKRVRLETDECIASLRTALATRQHQLDEDRKGGAPATE